MFRRKHSSGGGGRSSAASTSSGGSLDEAETTAAAQAAAEAEGDQDVEEVFAQFNHNVKAMMQLTSFEELLWRCGVFPDARTVAARLFPLLDLDRSKTVPLATLEMLLKHLELILPILKTTYDYMEVRRQRADCKVPLKF